MNYGESYANTEKWWHCGDDEITEISDFPKDVYTRESHKKYKEESYVTLRQNTVIGLYQNKIPHGIQLCF